MELNSQVAMDGVNNILRCLGGEVVKHIVDCGGLDAIKTLQMHEDFDLSQKARTTLCKYFFDEAELKEAASRIIN